MSTRLKLPIRPPKWGGNLSAQSLQELRFVFVMWLLSRLLIIIAMQVIAPYYPATPAEHELLPLAFVPGFIPKPSLELFTHWDAAWFKQIIAQGYDYAADGKMHNIAFFPVFPLVVRAVMSLGFSVEIAGLLVNNLALLGAMILLYRWVEEHHGENAAKWATAVMAWCPFSLFGTVIYSEGLFLLFSTAALRVFEKHQYARAALWGALTTGTRVTGVVLIPTFLFLAWREKRPPIAYLAGLATSGGLLLYMLYCLVRFGDPLAFVHVQKAWGTASGINWQGWWSMVVNLFRWRWGAVKEFTKLFMVFGSAYLFWYMRHQITRVAAVYGFFSILLIINSGAVLSVNRYVYGVVTASLALGVLLSRHPRWGYATMGLFGTMLVGFAIRFAWWRWVA
ncbi:mannosyltransferase family protein [Allocoleopsis sp.]|uniref:mannosyltransferase family protein n=1 Tax=Allocoleopsis sp. TaxID=3088169 RepID=UPI002FD741E7